MAFAHGLNRGRRERASVGFLQSCPRSPPHLDLPDSLRSLSRCLPRLLQALEDFLGTRKKGGRE